MISWNLTKASKKFFCFTKKQQKDFCSASRLRSTGRSHIKKSKFFLLLFFHKKEDSFYLYLEPPMADIDLNTRLHRIQEQVRHADALRPPLEMQGAMQAGARPYPAPPFELESEQKPGSEATLKLAPLYDAPYWKGSAKLQDKVAIITGGDSGIGRAVAVLFAREGADVAIIHLEHESEDASAVVRAIEAEGRRGLAIPGDVTDRAFCFAAASQVANRFGKIDVLVNNAAFQLHVSRFEDLTEDHFDLTIKTNL
jgi:hypothetical protein